MQNSPELRLDDINDSNIPIDCKIYSPDDLPDINDSKNGGVFTVFHTNIRSCRRNFTTLQTFLSASLIKFTVVVLTEIWLSSRIDYCFDLPGYNAFNLYRDNRGGGIKIFVEDSVAAKLDVQNSFICDLFEILTLSITLPNLNLIICGIYKPPHTSILDFTTSLYDNVIKKFSSKCKYILCGDFNINILNPLKLNSIDIFMQTLNSVNFLPVITRPTKHNSGNTITEYSLIDHFWCNFLPNLLKSAVVLTRITDHFSILISFKVKMNKINNRIKFRENSMLNKQNFVNKVNELNVDIDGSTPAHLNSSFNQFYNKIFNIYDESMPVRYKTINNKSSCTPWMTPDLKYCINKKYRLLRLLRRGVIGRDRFREYRNILNITIKQAKELYFYKKFMQNNGNMKKTWNIINDLMNRGKVKKKSAN